MTTLIFDRHGPATEELANQGRIMNMQDEPRCGACHNEGHQKGGW